MSRIPQFARAGVHDTDKRFRWFLTHNDAQACAFWYGCGGDAIVRGFEIDPGTDWYWRDRETGLICARGTVAMAELSSGEQVAAIFWTDGGWESLWDDWGVLAGASTKEWCGVMVDAALGPGKRKIGVVVLTDLQFLPRQAWFNADDLLERARNPYSCADRQDMAVRFEEQLAMPDGNFVE
jgi:hypothetical protein